MKDILTIRKKEELFKGRRKVYTTGI